MRFRVFNTFQTVSPFLRNLIPHLARHGHEVELFVSGARYRSGPSLERLLDDVKGVRIRTMPAFGVQPTSAARKAVIAATFALFAGVRSLIGGRVDANLFLTQPPLFVAVGRALKALRRQPYAYVMMDVYPDLLVAIRGSDPGRPLTRLLRAIQRFGIAGADFLAVLGRCMFDQVTELGGVPERMRIIPNWADEREVYPVPREANPLREDQGWADDFVVMYAGNVGRPQNFDGLLDAAEHTQDIVGLRYVVLGEGASKAALQQQKLTRGISNLSFLPFLHDRYTLAEITAAADLHFVTLRSTCTGLAVPSKAYGPLATGTPLLFQGDAECEIARMIEDHDVGITVGESDTDGLIDAIKGLKDDGKAYARRSDNALALSRTTLDRESILEQYRSALEQIVRREHLGTA